MPKITDILLQKINDNATVIENWFETKFKQTPELFYNSTDLRHNGFKIAPIDTNCFPAGFNNLNAFSCDHAQEIAKAFLCKYFPKAEKILIIPENHTRNLRYLKNVSSLQRILDFKETIVAIEMTQHAEMTKVDLENGEFLYIHTLSKKDGKLTTAEGFQPDLVILNNDLTDGIPDILKDLKIPVIPSPNLGWHSRSKSNHFSIYNKLAEELCELIDLDPWLISSLHSSCNNVSFKEKIGTECLANEVENILHKISIKYQEYGIDETPYCYIKADSGTYGMAIMPVFSKEDVLEINKKERNKMNMLKGSVQNSSVIIQEGIKTIDRINDIIAEPMIYMIGGKIVGNLFRANDGRDEKISLNAGGAHFFDLNDLQDNQLTLGSSKNNMTRIYALVSRLAALAASQENSNLEG